MSERLETLCFDCDFEAILSGQYDNFVAVIESGSFVLEEELLQLVVSSGDRVEFEINGRKLDAEFKVEAYYDTKLISLEDSTRAMFDANMLTAFDIMNISIRGIEDTSEYHEDIRYCLEKLLSRNDIKVECKLSKGPFDHLA